MNRCICPRPAVLSAIVLLVAGPSLAAYEFEFAPSGDTVLRIEPGEVAEFGFSLANTGTAPDVYEFNCRVIQGVPDWSVTYCVGFR
jgi:hypothetical protein